MVEVVEAYRNWSPPAGIRSSIENLLDGIPSRYSAGLARVILSNASGLTGNRKRKKIRSRYGVVSLSQEVLGLYHGKSKNEQPAIEIFVDRVVEKHAPWQLRVGIIREAILARTLYHEIGHHIERTQQPTKRNKEGSADDWTQRLARMYFRKRYWYLRAIAAPARWMRHLFGLVRAR